jgi:YD repeat-containing protein
MYKNLKSSPFIEMLRCVALRCVALRVMLCSQVKAQNIYENHISALDMNHFLVNVEPQSVIGVSINITDDVLNLVFHQNFLTKPLKYTCEQIYTTPTLPDIAIGTLIVGSNYHFFEIKNGKPCISQATQTSGITSMPMTFSINLRFIGPKYTYKSQVTLYGYGHNIPIAEVLNATLNQVAYTSFESIQETPTWIIPQNNNIFGNQTNKGRTGEKYFSFRYTTEEVRSPTVPAGRYLLTYWTRNEGLGKPVISLSNGTVLKETAELMKDTWQYEEKLINFNSAGQVIIKGGRAIVLDELRLYPEKAVMTTQTYSLQNGITSKTDAHNFSEYYEYDGFGRLILVKDEMGNIIKQHHYYLKPQN